MSGQASDPFGLNNRRLDFDPADPSIGPGPVHVLSATERGRGPEVVPLTACGLEVYGLLYNLSGGPTNCLQCRAAIVEIALVECVHGKSQDDCDVCRRRGIWADVP